MYDGTTHRTGSKKQLCISDYSILLFDNNNYIKIILYTKTNDKTDILIVINQAFKIVNYSL